MKPDAAIELFSTCLALDGAHRADYARRIIDAARLSDEAGCRGILVYTGNNQEYGGRRRD